MAVVGLCKLAPFGFGTLAGAAGCALGDAPRIASPYYRTGPCSCASSKARGLSSLVRQTRCGGSLRIAGCLDSAWTAGLRSCNPPTSRRRHALVRELLGNALPAHRPGEPGRPDNREEQPETGRLRPDDHLELLWRPKIRPAAGRLYAESTTGRHL